MTVMRSAEAGEATVLAAASGEQASKLEGCQLACAHNPGYEHSASYNAVVVRHTVLDAVVRLIQPVQTI